MDSLSITKSFYKSPEWFIDLNKTCIIVFRRDFISKIIKTSISGGIAGLRTNIQIEAPGGQIFNVSGACSSIRNLKAWYNKDGGPSP